MMQWLNMNGDGVFVWPCYVLTLLVLLLNVWVARRHHGALLKTANARAVQVASRDSSTMEPSA